MSFEELLPAIEDQAYYAVIRYDKRCADKIQEFRSMSYEKFLSDKAKGIDINKNIYKQFITQRSKELDFRSVVKKGYGGTSTMDTLDYFQRRPDSDTQVVLYDDWMNFTAGKNMVEQNYNFQIDFEKFFTKLSKVEQKVFQLKASGLKLREIADKMQLAVWEIKDFLKKLKNKFVKFFELQCVTA